jgi:hypothetical protein
MTTPDNLGPQLMKNDNVGLWETIKSFDLSGSLLLTTTVTFLILAMNLGGNVLPWSHPFIIVAIIFAIIGAGTLIRVEKRADRPIMPLKILFGRPRGNLVFSNFLASVTMSTSRIPNNFAATNSHPRHHPLQRPSLCQSNGLPKLTC